MTRLAVYVAFGVLFGGLLAGLWLSSRLAGPLEEIERATRQIAEGNFGVDLRRIPDGELASLYRAVDDMGRRLAERERQIRESAAEVERNERLTQIGSLAAGVAHEINNPLTFISASQEVVRDALTLAHEVAHTTDAQERARQLEALEAALARGHNALDDMNHGINRVTRIVRDLGQLSRSPASDDIHPLDLRWPIEKALEMARHHIESRARVVLDLDPGLVVKADAGRLEQVFVNLFVNAAHAMKEHAAATNILRIAAHRRRAAVVVEITDSGKGIAAEHVSKIFMPFFSTKRAGEGSGIGLAMCKRILESFDGSIELLYADPGRTTFRVSLPACDEAVQPAPRPASERLVLASSEPRRRVLAVDDEPTLLAAVQRSLCQQHDVVTVGSAEEALRLLRADDGFDLVLCDITIPGMSGVELFQRVKEVLPVVAARFMFMTGGILDDSVQRFLAEVPNRALCKPFTPVELRQAVGDALAATRRWSPSSADERNNQGHA